MTEELVRISELGVMRHHLLSRRLRERRRVLGLTQKEVVARLRRMGVTTTNKALSSLEHGAGLDVAKLPELACALECTLTWLVGLTDDPDSWCPGRGQWPVPPTTPGTPAHALAAPAQANGHDPHRTPVSRDGLNGYPPILGPLPDA